MSLKPPVLFLAVCSCCAFAQEQARPVLTQELLQVWRKHAAIANGRTDPQAIPYGVAMERVFWDLADQVPQGDRAFRDRLRARFPVTDEDAHRLGNVAAQSFEFAATVRNEGSQRYDDICAQLVNGQLETLNAVEVARRFQEVEREKAERLSAYYRDSLADLTPAALSGLNLYVDAEVRPRLTWGHDLVGLASEVPGAFLAHRRQSCEQRLKRAPSDKKWERRIEYMTLDLPEND